MSFTLRIEHLCFRPSNREEVTNIIKALESISPRALLDLLGMSETDRRWEETLEKKINYFPFKYETPPARTHESELNQIVKRDKEWEEQVLKLRVFHYLQAYVSEAITALKIEKRREKDRERKRTQRAIKKQKGTEGFQVHVLEGNASEHDALAAAGD